VREDVCLHYNELSAFPQRGRDGGVRRGGGESRGGTHQPSYRCGKKKRELVQPRAEGGPAVLSEKSLEEGRRPTPLRLNGDDGEKKEGKGGD